VDWREGQFEAMVWASASTSRFVVANMPTGSGKSLVYVALAQLIEPDRTLILTSTKGLQDQLMRYFRSIGMVDVRGQGNYVCELERADGKDWVMVDQGICHLGVNCLLKHHGCTYYDAVRAASKARVVVTNYSFWLNSGQYAEGIGNFGLVVMDEAHNAPEELAGFLAVQMDEGDLGIIGRGHPPVKFWQEWATSATLPMETRLAQLVSRVPKNGRPPFSLFGDIRRFRSLVGRLKSLSSVDEGWVMEREERGTYRWDPVNVASRAETYLFRGAPKIFLTSATVTPKTTDLLGIEPGTMSYMETPSHFPPERRPVIWVPTVRMRWDGGKGMLRSMVNRVDQILARRADRKGIIHTVSYSRAKYIMENSRFKNLMVTHTTSTTRQVVEEFKASKQPLVLVSPSLGTGWDFPYEDCEYQIIVKVPFPDMRAEVMKRRSELDDDLSQYMAAVELIQMVGRAMRAADDVCETLVIDDSIQWFVRRNRRFFPRWFLSAFRKSETVPAPMPKLWHLTA